MEAFDAPTIPKAGQKTTITMKSIIQTTWKMSENRVKQIADYDQLKL